MTKATGGEEGQPIRELIPNDNNDESSASAQTSCNASGRPKMGLRSARAE